MNLKFSFSANRNIHYLITEEKSSTRISSVNLASITVIDVGLD